MNSGPQREHIWVQYIQGKRVGQSDLVKAVIYGAFGFAREAKEIYLHIRPTRRNQKYKNTNQ